VLTELTTRGTTAATTIHAASR